jgi:hypothetical protein
MAAVSWAKRPSIVGCVGVLADSAVVVDAAAEELLRAERARRKPTKLVLAVMFKALPPLVIISDSAVVVEAAPVCPAIAPAIDVAPTAASMSIGPTATATIDPLPSPTVRPTDADNESIRHFPI